MALAMTASQYNILSNFKGHSVKLLLYSFLQIGEVRLESLSNLPLDIWVVSDGIRI